MPEVLWPNWNCLDYEFVQVTYIDDTRHLIVHLEKEPNLLYIRRKSQIGCKFRERAKLDINSEKEPN